MVSKEVIKQCIRSKRNEIESAEVNFRPIAFEPNGNYVFVGLRHVGKSYMLYQRVKQLLADGIGWDEILFVDFEDERLAELDTADLNLLIETHLETYGKKPYVFLDEIQNIPYWDKFVRRLANEKYHVYVTGSNAKMLSKDVATTLGGRFFIIDIKELFSILVSFFHFLPNSVKLREKWVEGHLPYGETTTDSGGTLITSDVLPSLFWHFALKHLEVLTQSTR